MMRPCDKRFPLILSQNETPAPACPEGAAYCPEGLEDEHRRYWLVKTGDDDTTAPCSSEKFLAHRYLQNRCHAAVLSREGVRALNKWYEERQQAQPVGRVRMGGPFDPSSRRP